MLKQDGKDPLQVAMEKAVDTDELDYSGIDWRKLHNELSFDVSISRAAHEVDDPNLQRKRSERRDLIRRYFRDARRLYEEDLRDDRGIAQHYPLHRPDPLAVLSDLERAAEGALKKPKDPPAAGNAGERIVSPLTEQTFLNTLVERMARRYTSHFGLEATYKKRKKKTPSHDSPFLRLAHFALLEYGDKGYELSTIARALEEIRANTPRPRSKKKRKAGPAPREK